VPGDGESEGVGACTVTDPDGTVVEPAPVDGREPVVDVPAVPPGVPVLLLRGMHGEASELGGPMMLAVMSSPPVGAGVGAAVGQVTSPLRTAAGSSA